jgi:predicted metalloprotease with PDZ domain
MVLLLLPAPCLGAQNRPTTQAEEAAPPLEITYHLRLARPTTHILEVEIDVGKVDQPSLDFVLPAWAPGRYAIYDFAKNVQDFEAEGAEAQALSWSQPDKATWHVETQAAGGTVRVRYRVYANDLTGSFSQFDSTHASLTPASIYMYVAGHKPDPVTLAVEPPPPDARGSWQVISGFTLATDQHTFRAPNYDRLIDTPMEVSAECRFDQFQNQGKTFRVVVHSDDDEDKEAPKLLAKLTGGLQKIVASEMAMMPAPDFDHYTFLFHFAPDIPEGDGMEHLNSTVIIIRSDFSDDSVREALETAAHEFFHVWNVKRLRPATLGPFDYTREDYSPSLWFVEGITSYYAYAHLLRAGLRTRDDFLQHLAGEIHDLEMEPGRKLMSAESSSFHAWFYDRSPQVQETNFANSTISYYNKGALLGMLLDLEIRAQTRGEKSLDDVMRWMYGRFYEAPAATYYLPGRGYQEKDILDALNAVSGGDFREFFARYVEGTAPLPYAEDLARVGLKVSTTVAADAPPSLGILGQPADTGVRITAVREDGAADRAGLSRDDVLTAVDQLSLATEDLATRLRMYPPGAEVPFTVQRHGRQMWITVKLDPPAADQYSISEAESATPEQVSLRDHWLGKN